MEGGDGSTLNLDFTTGVLDPRLTFSRLSTATFVNSSGYVEIAAENMFFNSSLAGGSGLNLPPTGWSNAIAGATYTTTGKTLTIATNAGGTLRAYMYQSTSSGITGMRFTIRFTVTAKTGSAFRLDELVAFPSNGSTGDTFTVNGVSQAGSYTAWNAGSVIVYSAIPTGGAGAFPSIGCGIFTAIGATTSITITEPQLNLGATPCVYKENTSTVASLWNTPRFDYSPTNIGQPRGLLLEGQTQNVLFYSQDVTQATRWTIQGGIPSSYTSISATGGTAPDNTNTANLCTESTANNSRSLYQGLTAAAGTYTASVWVKAGTGSTRYIRLVLPSAAGNFVYVTVNTTTGVITQPAAAVGTATAASATVTPYPNSWYRIQLTGTLAAAVSFVFIVPLDSASPSVNTSDYGREAYIGNGSSFYVWGAQLESGSGASSYIPTGASQGTRNIDSIVMSDISSLSFNQSQGTIYSQVEIREKDRDTFPPYGVFSASTGSRCWWFMRHNHSTAAGPRILGNAFNTANTNIINGTSLSHQTGVFRFATSLNTNASRMVYVANGDSPDIVTAASFTLATAVQMSINNNPDLAVNELGSMWLQTLKYFPTTFSDTQLQTITNPTYVAPTFDVDFTTITTGADLTAKGITFNRLSPATFIDSNGYVNWAEANLMLQSNSFTTSPWTSSAVAMSQEGTSPVGTAWKMLENSAGNSVHRLDSTSVACSNNGIFTFSTYVKQGSGTRQAYFIISDNSSGEIRSKRLNPVDGTLLGAENITGTNGWSNASTTSESVGGGWYRLKLTVTKGAGTNVIWRLGMSDSSGNLGYNGDGVSYIYIAGAQINPGTTAQTYYPTTTLAYHGPRFDYSPTNLGEPRGLLIEGQAVNKAINSETFAGSFYIPNTTTLFNETTGTNPAGTVGNIWFAPTSNGDNRFLGPSLLGVSTTSKVTYSVWLKAKGTNRGAFLLFNSGAIVNSSGVVISQPADASASFTGNGSVAPTITNLSSTGWTRVAITTDAVLGGTGKFEAFLYPKGTSGQTTNDSLHIWGAQIEESADVSSYIPTGVSQVTRNADICYADNISSWYTQGIGTMLFIGRPLQLTTRNYLNFSTGTSQPRLLMYGSTATEVILYLQNGTGLNLIFPSGSLTLGSVNRMASSFKQAQYSCVVNGGTVGTSLTASPIMPSAITRLNIGMRDDQFNHFNGHVMQVRYYPTALNNLQLKALTV
jgi:hypothetical protein